MVNHSQYCQNVSIFNEAGIEELNNNHLPYFLVNYFPKAISI